MAMVGDGDCDGDGVIVDFSVGKYVSCDADVAQSQ